MFKYRSRCRWNMLLYIDGNLVEIRPSELFESVALIDSRYLELIDEPQLDSEPKKKKIKE